ncbi:F0F1 ATP synthase subunit delta [Aerococcaceae bacterium NML180378]|nr:F0F1 ATP synthase subunit delta [Aerococcaceae bacterium NML180378]
MTLFKKWMICKMTQEESKVTIQRPVIETNASRREKRYEDDLLRKIQTEFSMNALDALKEEEATIVRDENRTQYEQALLDRVMRTIHQNQHGDTSTSYNKQVKAETLMITSAVPLTEDEKERLVRKFVEKTNRPLRRITSVVDPSLITGLRLQSETFYYEVSGQKKLREIRTFLEKSWLQGDEK